MSIKFLEDIDIKLFNLLMDFAGHLIDRGYAKAWFNWIEWIGLTAFIYAAAMRADSGFLLGVAIISSILLFFIGLVGVEKLIKDLIPTIQHRKVLALFIVAIISSLGLWIVSSVFFSLLPASVEK